MAYCSCWQLQEEEDEDWEEDSEDDDDYEDGDDDEDDDEAEPGDEKGEGDWRVAEITVGSAALQTFDLHIRAAKTVSA